MVTFDATDGGAGWNNLGLDGGCVFLGSISTERRSDIRIESSAAPASHGDHSLERGWEARR